MPYDVAIDSFPHLGEHCDNDQRMALITLWLLGVFAVIASVGLAVGLAAL
jgi:hypothetical protein